MLTLLKSEWRKLVYVRANWGLLLAATFISALSVGVTPFILETAQSDQIFGLTLDQPAAIDATYANGISGYVFAIILGILMMAGEFRHGTAVATFLTAPKRGAVLTAKLATAALGGVLLMLISTGASLLTGYFVLLGFENAAEPSENLFANTLAAAAVGGAVLGIVGIAIGTLIRNQMLAIVGALVYLFVIDPLLLALWPDAGKFLPSGLITAMLSLDISAPELGFDTTGYLPALTATLVLLSYGAVFAFVAIATSLRRDID